MEAPKKILIIEDDPIVTTVYERQFKMRGFVVEVAGDGELGMRSLRRAVPDLVLLDLQLPKVSGIEILRFIRSTEATRTLPVIVFTNAYLGSLVDKAWKAGANRCLTKAFTPARTLIDVVVTTLSKPGAKAAQTSALAPAAPRPAGGKPGEETVFHYALRDKVLTQGPAFLAELRTHLTKFVKADTETGVTAMEDRLGLLAAMQQTAHVLTGNAGIAGLDRIADLASAIEALMEELGSDPQSINPSTLRTVATSVDLIGSLFDAAKRDEPMTSLRPKILVVDDEATSRRAVLAGLEKAKLQADAVEDSSQALAMAKATHYDLIFLDIDMPGMDGFELFSHIRSLPGYAKTPVVFVTILNDFNTRARSIISGANDLIAKPFLLIELALKALLYVHRGQGSPEPPAST